VNKGKFLRNKEKDSIRINKFTLFQREEEDQGLSYTETAHAAIY